MHRATALLRVSTVVTFCAALIGGGAVGAKAEITASVPAGVHWRASPESMPLWGPNRFWPVYSFIHSILSSSSFIYQRARRVTHSEQTTSQSHRGTQL